ncbi:hypothetical protein [Nocardiopsis dassonvillei]|uniref:hypothetical protein n=1 Tax=Nocardiopsis dassonvillei TaxID=2014 RepID=UPI00157D1E17|nr:hypothetical protein [Nocardiopsis dassonvillei]
MNQPKPHTQPFEELIKGLRTWASGYAADRAAVELLITHSEWLNRADFQRYMEPLFDADGQSLTVIDWDRAAAALAKGRMPASSSAVAVLRIALSLAVGKPVDLCDAMTGLDATNTAAVAVAVVTAAQAEDRVTVSLKARELPEWLRGAER